MKYIVGGAAMGGRGLKTADYSALLDKAKEQREASHHQFKKVKHISAKSGASKEAGLLRLHKGVWQDEWGRLVEERSRTESGLEEWRTLAIRDGDDMGELMRTLLEYEADLKEEGTRFERDTLMPVRRLQAHLRGCSSKEGMAEGGRRGREVSRSDVLSEISVVKRQQELVQSELSEEYFTLWKDLIEFQKEHVPERKGVWLFGAPPTVPSHDVECSNDKLKGLLTEQFNKLNQHYISIFHQLRESCQRLELMMSMLSIIVTMFIYEHAQCNNFMSMLSTVILLDQRPDGLFVGLAHPGPYLLQKGIVGKLGFRFIVNQKFIIVGKRGLHSQFLFHCFKKRMTVCLGPLFEKAHFYFTYYPPRSLFFFKISPSKKKIQIGLP